jgi:hypothetical protein
MRKVFLNKWFFLAALLTISLSAFSFVVYKQTRRVCTVRECCQKPSAAPGKKGEMPWDAVSEQFTSLISIQ